MYDRNTVAVLTGESGREVLAAAADVAPDLGGLTALRKRFPPDLATLAHLTVTLRKKAARKFERAEEMYFLPEALEQSTGESVARHKARRFRDAGRVFDVGCGIGGDAIALAGETEVIASDRDGLRLSMAVANVRAYHGRAPRAFFVQSDFDDLPPPAGEAIHVDPARRRGGRRQRDAADFSPSLEQLRTLLGRCPDTAICLGPATAESNVRALGDGEIEVVSVDGECRALTFWGGRFRTATRRATLLPNGATLTGDGTLGGLTDDATAAGYVAVPDPAVTRAHLVRDLAERIGAEFLASRGSLLTVEAPPPGPPWVRCYPVLADFAYSKRRLKSELRARGIAHPIVSVHGLPIEPRTVPTFADRGPPDGRVFLIRSEDGTRAIITVARVQETT